MKHLLILITTITISLGLGFNTPSQKVDISEQEDYKKLISIMEVSTRAKDKFSLATIYTLGLLEKDTKGVTIKPNFAKAKENYLKAEEMGFKNSEIIMYSHILNTPAFQKAIDPDLVTTIEKLEIYSKEKKNINAHTLLAKAYLMKNDIAAVVESLEYGATLGDASSAMFLSEIFFRGVKTNCKIKDKKYKDEERSNYYLNLACNNPNKTELVVNYCNSLAIKAY